MSNSFLKQECIPVGCIQSASVAVCWLGGLLHTHTPGAGTPSRAGTPQEQAPPWRPVARHAGIPPARHARIPSPRDLLQGMLGYHLQGMLGYSPPPSCGQTHTCKNITFTTLLRMVISTSPSGQVS